MNLDFTGSTLFLVLLLFAAGLIGAAGSFAPGDTAKFVLLLAPLVLACGLSTVMSWRFYREESRK